MTKIAVLGSGSSSVAGLDWFLVGYGEDVFVVWRDHATDETEVRTYSPGDAHLGDGPLAEGSHVGEIREFSRELKPSHDLNWDDKRKAAERYWSFKARNEVLLRVGFESCGEIRMGSRFQACRLRLEGPWIPDVPVDAGWQNVSATSPDGRFVGLVRWDIVANEPGFQIMTVDCHNRTLQTSARMSGCCESLSWDEDAFVPDIWRPPPMALGRKP